MQPRVTVVVTQRERMSLTARSLESILSDRSEPFALICVDGGSPTAVRAYLEAKSAEEGFQLIQRQNWLWPNAARNLALPHVKTEYVVFIDNDVLIEEGWLRKLVRAADETGAALVGPLYLWSDGYSAPRIHMAGGILSFEETSRGLELFERHDRINESVDVRSGLVRGACDFLEYHCMLARSSFLKDLGELDERIVCVHEHIDLALEARKRNLPIIIEPSSAVNYLAFVPYSLSDQDFYHWRWSETAVSASLAAFCQKWGAVEDGEALKDVLSFAAKHREDAGALAQSLRAASQEYALTIDEVQQTPFGLMKQAFVRGYKPADLMIFGKAYNAAMTILGDGFRPCGRPFLLHSVGTASILTAFGFSTQVVVSSLLHAAYMHAPVGNRAHASLDAVKYMLNSQFGEKVEQTVRAYTRFRLDSAGWCEERPFDDLTINDAEVMAIALANEIEEHAAGEYLFTDKRPAEGFWLDYAKQVADGLHVRGLVSSLASVSRNAVPEGFLIKRKFASSFRIHQGAAIPMAHAHFRQWDSDRHAPERHTSPPVKLAG